jgi:archaellum component FlaG (FlaF/FlaG flagellin family)
MTESPSLKSRGSPVGLYRRLGASAAALAIFASQTGPALAAIDNTATANGTPSSGTLTPPTSSVSVPVATGAPTLTVVKTAGAATEMGTDGVINAGDRITYTYVVTNTGNVTINAARPLDAGPTFNTIAGTGTLSAFSPVNANLAPGASQTFTAIYTLSNLDAYRAAGIPLAGTPVQNSATATGTPVSGTLAAVTPSTAKTTIPANPKLAIAKSFVITTDNGQANRADVGDVITYTYVVQNTGNVTITSLSINDIHEGVALSGQPANETLTSDGPLAPGTVSSDSVANNAVYSTIRPGATVTFTYVHTVTQAEVDAG